MENRYESQPTGILMRSDQLPPRDRHGPVEKSIKFQDEMWDELKDSAVLVDSPSIKNNENLDTNILPYPKRSMSTLGPLHKSNMS